MFRTIRGTTAVLGGVAVSALLLAGCTVGDADAEPTSLDELMSASAAEPAPEATQPSAEEAAAKAAQEAVREFYRVGNAAWQDPQNADVESFDEVAFSSALVELRNGRVHYIREGWRQQGEYEVGAAEVARVDLTNKPRAKPPIAPTVELLVCIDATNQALVGKDGTSVEPPDAPERRPFRFVVQNHDYPGGPWLVESGVFRKGESC